MLRLFPGPEVKVTDLGSEDPDLVPALADLKALALNQEAVTAAAAGSAAFSLLPQSGRKYRMNEKKSHLRSPFCSCTKG